MGLNVGDILPLYNQLGDYNASKYVRAFVTDPDGAAIAGSPFNLLPSGSLGLYKNVSGLMPNKPWVFAQYIVYDDAGYTQVSTSEGAACDTFYRNTESDIFLPVTSNIVAFVDSDDCSKSPIEDTIVQGCTRLLTIRLATSPGGQPFPLVAADIEDIEFRMRNIDGTILSVKMSDAGSPITIVNEGAGQITVELTSDQTLELAPASPAPATLRIESESGVTVVNIASQIAVEETAVEEPSV